MKKKVGRFIKQNKVIIVLLIISVMSPVILALARFSYDRFIGHYDTNWFSFFGSYLGGVFGGIATLIAVLYTIKSNVTEQDRKEENEKQKEIKKSALIVYYDFKFAFNNIADFLNLFSRKCASEGHKYPTKYLYNKEDIELYKKCTIELNQFYLDDNWIHTVANLHDPALFGEGTIKKIYEIYGHLSNINKSIERPDDDIIRNAFESMTDIFEYKCSKNGSLTVLHYAWCYDVKAVMKCLENTAFQYDSRMMSAGFVKDIIVDLFDQLIALLHKPKDKSNSNDVRTTASEEAVYSVLAEIAKKYQFDIPKSEQSELKKQVTVQLNALEKNVNLSNNDEPRKYMRRIILPILQIHGYPSAPKEIFDDVRMQLMDSEKH